MRGSGWVCSKGLTWHTGEERFWLQQLGSRLVEDRRCVPFPPDHQAYADYLKFQRPGNLAHGLTVRRLYDTLLDNEAVKRIAGFQNSMQYTTQCAFPSLTIL